MDELTNKYTAEFEPLEDVALLEKYTYVLMQYRNGNRDKIPDLTTQLSAIMDIAQARNLDATAYAVQKIKQDKGMMKEFKETSIFKEAPHPGIEQLKSEVDKQIDKSVSILAIGIIVLMLGLAFTASTEGKVLFYGAVFVGVANIIVGGLGVILGMSTRSKIKKENL